MQVELIGCTSAGKSTLARSIVRACREEGVDIVLGDDLALQQIGLGWIRGRRPRRALVNLVALAACLIGWRRYAGVCRFAARLLSQLPTGRVERLNTLRNVVTRLGIHEIVRRRSHDGQVILVDEGVLQAAHYLFVHVRAHVDAERLWEFAGLVPKPDVVVRLRQPASLLIERTVSRGHQRIPGGSRGDTARFVQRAGATFDRLTAHPEVASRLLVVEGDERVCPGAGAQDSPALRLAARIVRSGLGGGDPAIADAAPGSGRRAAPSDLVLERKP